MPRLESLTVLLFFFCFTYMVIGQINSPGGVTCETSGPICSNNSGSFVFQNNNDPSTNIPGSIACLMSVPRPAWFFFRIDQSGTLEFDIEQTSTQGIGLDVDFVLWGPFRSQSMNCNSIDLECKDSLGNTIGCPSNTDNPTFYINDLDNSNIVDCSYDNLTIESMTIPNAVADEFYLLLVTNFDGGDGTIEVVQTNSAGAGTTDCSIVVDGILGPDIDVCEPDTVSLNANPTNNNTFINYNWEYNDGSGFVPLPAFDGLSLITVSQTGEYRVTITDDDGDTGEDSVNVLIAAVPTANPVPPLSPCDDTNTGFRDFDLDALRPDVFDGQSQTDFTVNFYDEPANAETGASPLPDTYTNAAAYEEEIIYARIENNANTNCYDITSFTIVVNPLPQLPTESVRDYIQCEVNNTGFSNSFDLSTKDAEVLQGVIAAGNDPSNYELSYHENQSQAQDAIAYPTGITGAYTNSTNPQGIFVRIVNKTTKCLTSTSNPLFNIGVNEAVFANTPANPEEECAISLSMNDTANFNLSTTSLVAEIMGSQQNPPNFVIGYYETEENAEAGDLPIPNPENYQSISQTIYARVDDNTLDITAVFLELNNVIPVTVTIDIDGDTINDLIDTDADNFYDAIRDIDGDPFTNEILATNSDNVVTAIDINGDSMADAVDYLDTNGMYGSDGNIDNVEDSNPCYAVTELELQVIPLTVFTLEPEYILCVDTNGTEAITTPVIDTGLSDTNYTFEWFFNDTLSPPIATSSSIVPQEEGTYIVEVTDNKTCISQLATMVRESSPPTVNLEIDSIPFTNNKVLIANVGPDAVETYEFSLDYGPWQNTNIFADISSGEHLVTVRDLDGCGQSIATITLMDYPLYFTPNNDGFNDYWNISGENISIANVKIYIFDRYGKLLEQISPLEEGWDGTHNGLNMPSSNYWFKVEYTETETEQKKTFQAHFTLKR